MEGNSNGVSCDEIKKRPVIIVVFRRRVFLFERKWCMRTEWLGNLNQDVLVPKQDDSDIISITV